MTPFVTFRIAVRALLRNKTRSVLTTLGVIIGVGAVIAMVAIGEGAKQRVRDAFASMGANLLILLPGSTQTGGVRGGFGSGSTLTWDDLHAIQREVTTLRYAAPALGTSASVVSAEQNWTTRITGTTPEYFLLRGWPMAKGVAFGPAEVDGQAKVVILGQTVIDHLYGAGIDPTGQVVRIKGVPFTVVAVMAKQGQSPTGQDFDDAAFVPVTTYQSKIAGGLSQYINGMVFLGATSSDATPRAEAAVRSLLRDRHHLQGGADDDFNIRNLAEFASAQEQGTQVLTTLLAAIAAVSLLVGGIGIMNIMLVSVTERTREIGVRMAVGAKRRHILAQFLVEALTLSVIGGMLGIALGIFAAQKLADSFGWPTLVRPDIVLIAVAFSGAIGVGFGLYPARKASLLDPIDALRYE